MPTVTFQPSGVKVEVEPGASVLEAGLSQGVAIQTTCGGKASCRDCRVIVLEGSQSLGPVTFAEERALGNVFFITRERLSCQSRVLGEGVVVEVPPPRPPVPKKPFRPHRAR